VRSLFLTRGGSVRVCMLVYTHARTHTAHGVLDVSPGIGTGHLEVPTNPDGLNLGIYIFEYVYKVHMCNIYTGRRNEIWTNCLFSLNIFLPKKRGKRCDRKTEYSKRNQIRAA